MDITIWNCIVDSKLCTGINMNANRQGIRWDIALNFNAPPHIPLCSAPEHNNSGYWTGEVLANNKVTQYTPSIKPWSGFIQHIPTRAKIFAP